jgi:Fe2+ transport system protein B
MIMLFIPCSATLSVVRKEGGSKIFWIQFATSIWLAYVLSGIVYWTAFGISALI